MIGLSGEQEEEMMIEAYRYFTLCAVSHAAAYGWCWSDDVGGQKCQEMKKTLQFVLDLQLNMMLISIVYISINYCYIVSYNVLVILLFCISWWYNFSIDYCDFWIHVRAVK